MTELIFGIMVVVLNWNTDIALTPLGDDPGIIFWLIYEED